MKTTRNCPLCDESAAISPVSGEGGNRARVDCEADCPPYEITRRAEIELERNPSRKAAVRLALCLDRTQRHWHRRA